ncbi:MULTISPECIES: hypothetical protein [unclassified Idiomarina]|jgi:hypothetical protein|uniref:hypothetical protein n=1 Tax=unclassified Idiomarina TaxID=2614829 RepID=UPI000C3AF66C|nr:MULTISPECIES: hypothetical protein [unclassified Idiomarina]MAA61265.1 hypothetical protein [Idiomarina sp.]|tara:strand:- start:53013 stop:53750 length:738 start_codon:yes stop_codon:yes gene_type:complete
MKVSGHEAGVLPQVVSNSTVKVSPSDNGKEPLQSATRQLAQDVYSKEEQPDENPVYSRPLVLGVSQEYADKMRDSLIMTGEAIGQLYLGGDMYHSADKMASEYDLFMSTLKEEAPHLAEKDWGFSVDADGELKVSGELSQNEIISLEDRLNKNEELVSLAQSVKEQFLKYTELERNDNGGASKLWGKYDVNTQNFSEIIDIRALMEGKRESEETTERFDRRLDLSGFVSNIENQLNSNAEIAYSF